MSVESAPPVSHHLFDIAEDVTKLSQINADLVNHFLENILYLSKQARPDIQPEVLLLFTRVRYPDTDDYKNLKRVMEYVQGNIGLPLILSIEKSGNKVVR